MTIPALDIATESPTKSEKNKKKKNKKSDKDDSRL
jgi:hypothetical protein